MGLVKDVSDSYESVGKGTILIVDDSRMSRTMLRGIFERGGYTVVMEAANGEDGVEAYKKYLPDIVTLDITMPKKDGISALEEIMAFDPDALVVMITAAGQQDKLINALRIGARQFISKPYSEEEILFNINSLLE
ncbi:MAG: response regulator [Lachnospiraceae bacterium]|nr:response regulator [Lachnospiraceae bacterium]